ncbi:MAG: nucleotidyltransferase family protein [Candidatus Micrarchaeia archaeon]
MNTIGEIKKILGERKEEIRQKYGVRIVGIFGSYARNEQKETSDILIELERPIGLKFFELWDYLEELVGLKVDLLTVKALKQKPILYENVMEDLVYV